MKYKLLFEKSSAALVLFDNRAQILEMNPAAETLFEYEGNKCEQFNLFDFVPEHFKTLAQNSWQEFLSAKRHKSFTIIRTCKENLRCVSYYAKANVQPGLHLASVHPMENPSEISDIPEKKIVLTESLYRFLQDGLLQRATEKNYDLSKLISTEKHFYNLFENVPVPIIESDCSKIRAILAKNKAIYGNDPKKYFIDNPSVTHSLIKHFKIREINKTALYFFKISNKIASSRDLFKVYDSFVNHSAPTIFEGFLNNITNIMYETEVSDFEGKSHSVIMRLSTESDDYSRTFITFEDISATKKIQEQLEIHVKERTIELEAANKKLRREISFREQVSRDLQISEDRYKKLYTIYPVGIFHVNNKRITTYVNSKLAEIEGVSIDELHDGRWIQHIHPEDQERVVTSWQEAFNKNESLNIEYRFKHGSKITWVNAQTVPEYDDMGKLVGHVGIVSDTTRLNEVEEQLKQTEIEMAHFARVHSMGEVASGLAHELNQPLTAISNFMSGCKRRLLSLTDQKIPKDILDAIDNAATQAQRAGSIIHNLKDFLRKGELCKQTFNLNDAIKDVLIFSKKSVLDHHIRINLKLAKNLPEIFADKIHLEQVILNIVNNAIDTINESPRETKEIIIRTKLYRHNCVRISIADSGMGIPKELIGTIFNPFMTTKPTGMGIGLSLCHNIIDKHQGTLTVTSKRGKGSIFHITLPIE